MSEIEHGAGRPVDTSTAQILYVMHGISPFTLWTLSIVAVIIGAIARDKVRGTWVESHYSWLARSFFWGLLWFVIAPFVFSITVVGLFLWFIPWVILTIRDVYTLIRGWRRHNDHTP